MNKTVSQEIFRQLGSKTIFMLGVKNVMTNDGNDLSFIIKGSRKVRAIRIILDSNDTYTMIFTWWRGMGKLKEVAKYTGVYSDTMHSIIEEETGLATSLSPIGV